MGHSENNQTKITKETLISMYMEHVLSQERKPKTVYKFCKETNLEEAVFYKYFSSIESLEQDIWVELFAKSLTLMDKSEEVQQYNSREKLLTFYFTFFEMLTVNRSYLVFSLKQESIPLKNLLQLKGLRTQFLSYAKVLIAEDNEKINIKFLKRNQTIFSEAAWLQFLFLIKFWLDDTSPQFEKTDMAIEKSVNTAFDVFNHTPLDRIIDFGKFLYKEKMA